MNGLLAGGCRDSICILPYARTLDRESRVIGAEGATAPETLRPKGPTDVKELWRDPAQKGGAPKG